jgi:hypothetical protein
MGTDFLSAFVQVFLLNSFLLPFEYTPIAETMAVRESRGEFDRIAVKSVAKRSGTSGAGPALVGVFLSQPDYFAIFHLRSNYNKAMTATAAPLRFAFIWSIELISPGSAYFNYSF